MLICLYIRLISTFDVIGLSSLYLSFGLPSPIWTGFFYWWSISLVYSTKGLAKTRLSIRYFISASWKSIEYCLSSIVRIFSISIWSIDFSYRNFTRLICRTFGLPIHIPLWSLSFSKGSWGSCLVSMAFVRISCLIVWELSGVSWLARFCFFMCERLMQRYDPW
jgi:hypothetical protein